MERGKGRPGEGGGGPMTPIPCLFIFFLFLFFCVVRMGVWWGLSIGHFWCGVHDSKAFLGPMFVQ